MTRMKSARDGEVSAASNECTRKSDGGEDSPLYHELDPVLVAGASPLSPLPSDSSFHAYQSIVDVQRDLFQLRASVSENSFDAATAGAIPPCCDVITATSGSGSKWPTLFSRLRLPRRATRQQQEQRQQQHGHVTVSASARSVTSQTPPPISGSRRTPPSCRRTSWRDETITTEDHVCLSTSGLSILLVYVYG